MDHRAVFGHITHITPIISQENNLNIAEYFIRQLSNKLCIKLPLKTEKDKYQTFADTVDNAIQAKQLDKVIVNDDETFLKLYLGLSTIITTTAMKVFDKSKSYTKHKEIITNPVIQSIVSNICYVGGAIPFEKSNHTAYVSLKAMKHHSDTLQSPSPSQSVLHCLTNNRKLLHKCLFAKCLKEIITWAKLLDKRKIAAALLGNSTRKLTQNFDYILLPLAINDLAINDLDNPERLICNPEEVKTTMMEYFRRLYDHSHTLTLPKPWMNTLLILEVHSCITKDPFDWPRKASLADLWALLQKGNNHPSSGPDQWEKWMVKSPSDTVLSLVLDLLNYQVIKSRFPGDIKDMWLTMFHKWHLHTDLQIVNGTGKSAGIMGITHT